MISKKNWISLVFMLLILCLIVVIAIAGYSYIKAINQQSVNDKQSSESTKFNQGNDEEYNSVTIDGVDLTDLSIGEIMAQFDGFLYQEEYARRHEFYSKVKLKVEDCQEAMEHMDNIVWINEQIAEIQGNVTKEIHEAFVQLRPELINDEVAKIKTLSTLRISKFINEKNIHLGALELNPCVLQTDDLYVGRPRQ